MSGYLQDAPHKHPQDCPSWHDTCNCTVENYIGQLDYTKQLLANAKTLEFEKRVLCNAIADLLAAIAPLKVCGKPLTALDIKLARSVYAAENLL